MKTGGPLPPLWVLIIIYIIGFIPWYIMKLYYWLFSKHTAPCVVGYPKLKRPKKRGKNEG